MRSVGILTLAVVLHAPSVQAGPTLLAAADRFDTPAPAALSIADRKMIYSTAYIVQMADETTNAVDPVVQLNGQSPKIHISTRNWCLAADEGSLWVTRINGTKASFIYAGQGPRSVVDCSATFPRMKEKLRLALETSTFKAAPSDAPFGIGSGSRYRLIPYRSIAVGSGPSAPFHIGDVVFIPALRGQTFKSLDGTPHVHDGYVAAVDAGGAISNNHIDFFMGPARSDRVPSHLASDKMHLLAAYLVRDTAVIRAVLGPHERQVALSVTRH